MNRDQLDDRYRAALSRSWPQMRDSGGRPPQQLLDDLAGVAGDWAAPLVRSPALGAGTYWIPPRMRSPMSPLPMSNCIGSGPLPFPCMLATTTVPSGIVRSEAHV